MGAIAIATRRGGGSGNGMGRSRPHEASEFASHLPMDQGDSDPECWDPPGVFRGIILVIWYKRLSWHTLWGLPPFLYHQHPHHQLHNTSNSPHHSTFCPVCTISSVLATQQSIHLNSESLEQQHHQKKKKYKPRNMSPIIARLAARRAANMAGRRQFSVMQNLRSFARSFEAHPFERLPVANNSQRADWGKQVKRVASQGAMYVASL
jgi:hypothetical protein